MPRRSTRAPKPDSAPVDAPRSLNAVDLEDVDTIVFEEEEDDYVAYDEDLPAHDEYDEEGVIYAGPPSPEIPATVRREPSRVWGFLVDLFWATVGTIRSFVVIALATTLAFFIYLTVQTDWDFDYAWNTVRDFYGTVWWLTKRAFAWAVGL